MFFGPSDNSAETADWVGDELLSIKGHGPHVNSTHSPLSYLTHYLSLEGRTREGKDELEWESEEEEGGEGNQDCKRVATSSTWASTISHLMVSSRIASSHYLEINPQTLTQVFSLAWMDHEDLLMGSNPSKKSLFSLEARMASVDLQPWWQGTHQEPKLRCHAQSLFIFRICS